MDFVGIARGLGNDWRFEEDGNHYRLVNDAQGIAVYSWGEKCYRTKANMGRVEFSTDTAADYRRERGQVWSGRLKHPRKCSVSIMRTANEIAAEIHRRLLPGCYELLAACQEQRAAAEGYTGATRETAERLVKIWPKFDQPRFEEGASGWTSAHLYGGPIDVKIEGSAVYFKVRTEGPDQSAAVAVALASVLRGVA